MPTPTPKNTTPLSRTIVLKLSSTLLGRFPSDSQHDEKDVKIKDASSPPSSTSGEVGIQASSSLDNASDAASSTPAGPEGSKPKKGAAGGARGTKRTLDKNDDSTAGGNAKPPRSRPSAAKKRLKLDEKALDSSKPMPPGHKLGPKANQGAINAGLRALDRSGAPCRKWERKSFQLKSFTGVVWGLSSWHSPKPPQEQQVISATTTGESEDVNGINITTVMTVNGEGSDTVSVSINKTNQMSSAVPSEKSNVGEGYISSSLPPSTAQSPAPVITMTG